MNNKRKKYCIANWKMNFTIKDIEPYLLKINMLKVENKNINLILSPSFLDIKDTIHLLKNSNIQVAAQNMHYKKRGSFTGEVSSEMLNQSGCKWVILGHSERRIYFNETDDFITHKVESAINSNIDIILCIGESKEQRKNNQTDNILRSQLTFLDNYNDSIYNRMVIAYEPVWAIGTGLTASAKIVSETLLMIRKILDEKKHDGNNFSLLYGGSVDDNNAKELSKISDLDGFLVGTASLDVDKFYKIYNKL